MWGEDLVDHLQGLTAGASPAGVHVPSIRNKGVVRKVVVRAMEAHVS